jgi:hypothetical protein
MFSDVVFLTARSGYTGSMACHLPFMLAGKKTWKGASNLMREYFYRQWKWNRPGLADKWHGNAIGGWFSAACGLHVLTVLALLTLILSSPPWGYVWTDATHLETLSWNEDNNQLSGQYSGISYAQVTLPSPLQPASYGAAYTGTLNGSTVTLTIGSGSLSEHLTGTQSGDDRTLILTFLDSTSTKPVQQRWVAVTQTQQGQLVAAFNAYQQARGWLALVQQGRQRERDWHDPNASFLATTQSALQNQQAHVEQMQQAQDMPTRCTLVAAYRPLDSSWFTLPFPASSDGLLSALARFQQAWQRAERSPVPHLAGLILPWLLSAADERRAIAPASTLALHIQKSYQADEQIMRQDQQQSKHLDEQVTTLSQGCPPTPA